MTTVPYLCSCGREMHGTWQRRRLKNTRIRLSGIVLAKRHSLTDNQSRLRFGVHRLQLGENTLIWKAPLRGTSKGLLEPRKTITQILEIPLALAPEVVLPIATEGAPVFPKGVLSRWMVVAVLLDLLW